MNFRIIIITLLASSFLFSKSVLKEKFHGERTVVNKTFDRSTEQIINIDFEGDLSGWTHDEGWELTTNSSNSPTHSYNSPDDNNTNTSSTHSLYSDNITLPSLMDEEIIQYLFSLNCNMPDFIQENDPTTPEDESEYLADYYNISLRDVNELSAWDISTFNPIDGNNWWCADEDSGGYLDGWIQYLDTPEFTVPQGGVLSADMSWNIEDPDGADSELPSTCNSTGWDQANVQISIDNGVTWTVINGSTSYDFECGYATLYNGFDTTPGWGGEQGWHNVTFDLSQWAGQDAIIRFAFYSDPAWSVIDDNNLTGLQIDNITMSGIIDDTADNSTMNPSGETWIDQFYDYCDTERPGYLEWNTYSPGDPFDGNTLMNLTEYAGKTIQFKFQTTYDGNHTSATVNQAQGEGLYIDDFIIYKTSTFNPISPNGLQGSANENTAYISWNDLNVSGSGWFQYDNGIFSPDHFIVMDGNSTNEAWAGTEFYTAGTSVLDSIQIYVFGGFSGKIAGFSSFGSVYNIEPNYSRDYAYIGFESSNDHGWIADDISDWTFYGPFIIAQELSEYSPVGYDPTSTPSSQSKIFLGNSWENWATIAPTLGDPLIGDGEWGIRAKLTYSSPEVTYNIYRNNELINAGIQEIPYVDENLEYGSSYTYNVSALYPNGTESEKSEDITVIIGQCDGTVDCFGICEGTAIEDCNGVCDGDAIIDCEGVCGGNATYNNCGICNDDPSDDDCVPSCSENNACNYPDCNQFYDDCFICGGPGIEEGVCDCDGNVDLGCGCGNPAPIVYYQDLDGDGLGYGTGQTACTDSWEGWVTNNDDDDEFAPGSACEGCGTNDCIYDCSENCADRTVLYNLINNGNCDNGGPGEFDLKLCDEFQGDGLDCIVNLSINSDLELPKSYTLGQNFPNPFNPYTVIPFAIPTVSNVVLKIYNILGQEVHVKSFNSLVPGNYQYSWDASEFQSGIYIYTMETNSGIILKEKMLLIK